MIGILLLFALLCLGGSFGADDGLRWLLAGTGVVGALVAFLTWFYALFRRPQLLRSERHQEIVRLIDLIGDSEIDQATRAELMKRLPLERSRFRYDSEMGDPDG
jgi:hypothetical protein